MMSSLITEDVRKMRIKGDYQFMEMRAKRKKVKNGTLSSLRQNTCQTEPNGTVQCEWASDTVWYSSSFPAFTHVDGFCIHQLLLDDVKH